ncbi:MAG TPA: GvpL/GvpF family gas vesicle protein [Thermoleophilaceae bacterium]
MIYLYAVTELEPHGFRVLGVDGEPVLSLPFAGMHLVHSFHADGFQPPTTPDALWAHEGVVDELLEAGPVVPFRYGTTMPGRDAAAAYLGDEAERFRCLLAELRGKVELAVRVALERTDEAPDGKSYLRNRARERDLLKPLDSLARASATSNSAGVMRASYLVDRDEVDGFATAVRELQARHPGLALSCTGPWAPYSFVSASR